MLQMGKQSRVEVQTDPCIDIILDNGLHCTQKFLYCLIKASQYATLACMRGKGKNSARCNAF